MGKFKGRRFDDYGRQQTTQPVEEQNFSNSLINNNVICVACQSKGSMIPSDMAKYGNAAQVLGYIVATISSIFLAFSLHLISTVSIYSGIGIYILPGAILFLLVGFILISKRRIYKCNNCGYFIDRV